MCSASFLWVFIGIGQVAWALKWRKHLRGTPFTPLCVGNAEGTFVNASRLQCIKRLAWGRKTKTCERVVHGFLVSDFAFALEANAWKTRADAFFNSPSRALWSLTRIGRVRTRHCLLQLHHSRSLPCLTQRNRVLTRFVKVLQLSHRVWTQVEALWRVEHLSMRCAVSSLRFNAPAFASFPAKDKLQEPLN